MELRATRKPRLLFRFVGVFLLRFAERQLFALLFQLPPRMTRLEPSLAVIHRRIRHLSANGGKRSVP